MTKPHGGSSNSRKAFNQLKFFNSNVCYDRIFTFGDLNTPGKCFVIITDNVTESDFLLAHMRQSSTVGDMIALIEPETATKALNDMPVMSTIMPLIPLAMLNNIPLVPLVAPQPGQQHYFSLKGIPIQMSCATMVNASCRGILCDQQQPPNRLVQCGCMFTSPQAAIILQVHVTFDYIDENGENQMHAVNNHCSWWMTKPLYLQSLQQLIALHFTPRIRALGSWLLHLCMW
jgi:hypothetical protein